MVTVKKISTSIEWTEYDSAEDIDPGRNQLAEAAIQAAGNAYAPYSGFRVGAALKLENGEIITGTNVENAAFPTGICAERNVLAASSSSHPGVKPLSLAIAALGANGLTDEPVPPCGNCRQAIAEEEYRHKTRIELILHGKSRTLVIEGMDNLLPLKFENKNLNPGAL